MSIKDDARFLKLSYTFNNCEEMIREAEDVNQPIGEFLQDLLDREVNLRLENGQKKRVRSARFPQKKYLVDFKTDHYDKRTVTKDKLIEKS